MTHLVVQLLQSGAGIAGDIVVGPCCLCVDAGLSDGSLRAPRALAETWLISILKDVIIEVICVAGYHQLPFNTTFIEASMTLIEAGLEGRSERSVLAHPSRVPRTVLDVIEAESLRHIVVEAVRV